MEGHIHLETYSRAGIQIKTEDLSQRLLPFIKFIPLLLVVFFWILAILQTDPTNMTDIGLVSVLPVWFYLALFLLAISFVYHLISDNNQAIILLHCALLALILFGTPQIIYGTVRYSWTYKHIGVIDFIQRYGSVNMALSNLGGYQNWPGFFILGVFINTTAELQSAMAYAGWGPAFFNLIDIGALVFVFRSLTRDQRLVWLAVWFFLIGNWIGQDYFSPQAESYFFYLVIFGIILRWLRVNEPPTKEQIKHWFRSEKISQGIHRILLRSIASGRPDTRISKVQQVALVCIVFLISIVMISSHQLTPFMVISGLFALTLFQVSRIKRLPIIFLVLTAAWLIFMAVDFLQTNTYWIIRTIGLLIFNANRILVNVSQLGPAQTLVANMDRVLSGGILVLALLGIWRRIHNKMWDLPAMLLILSPLPLLAANSYGGEMHLRVYYFALPFLAFFASALFFPTLRTKISNLHKFAISGISLVLLCSFLIAAYGKEEMNYFTPNEIQAAEFLYTSAPKGSMIIDGTWNWPKYLKNYDYYSYISIVAMYSGEKQEFVTDPVEEIASTMENYSSAFIILTKSQEAQVDLLNNLPPGSINRIETLLMQSPDFEIVYQNPDAVILTLKGPLPVPLPPDSDDHP